MITKIGEEELYKQANAYANFSRGVQKALPKGFALKGGVPTKVNPFGGTYAKRNPFGGYYDYRMPGPLPKIDRMTLGAGAGAERAARALI